MILSVILCSFWIYKINGRENIIYFEEYVEYLSEKNPYKISELLNNAIKSIPACVLYDFEDRGFKIKIVDDISDYIANISKDTVGLYVDSENCIYIEYKALLSDTNVLQHEMGHYIYFRLHLEDDVNLGECYMFEWDNFIDVYRDYGAKNELEYFAEYFAIYLNGCLDTELRTQTPLTYHYMETLYDRIENADLIIDVINFY